MLAYKANEYRRRARAELAALKERMKKDISSAAALPVLLKRTALAGFPRRKVAGLSGESWVSFLKSTCSEGFNSSAAELLVRLSYRGTKGVEQADLELLTDAVDTWIRRHRAAV